jgi:leucyl/phenylalanyl-tRNA---protein transferase
MPFFLKEDSDNFPTPLLADEEGLLAFGGNLLPESLLKAYSMGIFPWYAEDQPILWWSPDPRMVLFPKEFKRHKNLTKTVKSAIFDIRFDSNFKEVIENCSIAPREGQDGTWITDEMKEAYIAMHQLGYAHSVETYYERKLVGGLYGLSIGKMFFGESMFHLQKDASKVALWHLVDQLMEWEFDLIDVQQETEHLKSLGARTISRKSFLTLLEKNKDYETRKGMWTKDENNED